MKKFALAAMMLLPSAANADPLTDLISRIFSPQQDAALHPSNVGWRRTRPTHARPMSASAGTMLASYYGGGERLNSRTASGERFAPHNHTAAHRTLPFGTLLHVCYADCTTVRINDRGPAAYTGRSLDLSRGAAAAIGMLGAGVARVRAVVLR